MAKKLGIYKCELCGNITEVFVAGGGDLACCGQNMKYMEEKTADHSTEKHVPFVEKTEKGYKVRVGENAAHPMTEEHYIMWIELIVDDLILRKELKPNDKPEAEFEVKHSDNVIAREYCNIHGHWKN
ncbi:MAG: desulfoferrodoxin [Peptostreptococcaceae bacterium]|jgi:superoxide reductase|nr:desulfoferrodoxin [Peptostreptococcaceae bacterium]